MVVGMHWTSCAGHATRLLGTESDGRFGATADHKCGQTCAKKCGSAGVETALLEILSDADLDEICQQHGLLCAVSKFGLVGQMKRRMLINWNNSFQSLHEIHSSGHGANEDTEFVSHNGRTVASGTCFEGREQRETRLHHGAGLDSGGNRYGEFLCRKKTRKKRNLC